MSDRDWRSDGACLEVDPEAFFPEAGASTRDAKRICTGCEVRTECLAYALANDERFGIWGGLSERERKKLVNRPQAPVRDKYADQIRALQAEGKSDSEIGRLLNIPRTTVANIRRAVA